MISVDTVAYHPDLYPSFSSICWNRGLSYQIARKFHELNQAYELLLDPLRRLALDAKLRVKKARAERFKSYDTKRKNLVEELEERERAFKKARVQKQKEELEVYHQTERIKEEGRRMREEREKAAKEKEKEMLGEEEHKQEDSLDLDSELEPPPLGFFLPNRFQDPYTNSSTIDQFDTTVRLKYSLKSHLDLTTKQDIASYLSPFGAVDVDSIVFSMKTKKSKSKSKGSGESTFLPCNHNFEFDVGFPEFRRLSNSCNGACPLQKHRRRLRRGDHILHALFFLQSRLDRHGNNLGEQQRATDPWMVEEDGQALRRG